MKKTLSKLFSVASLTSLISCAESEQPNIILFLVDDMGWQDTSLPFHTDTTEWNRRFSTPNMERLAQKGVKFTNAYASPISSPSRVSLMTGVSPTRHRVTNWTFFKDTSTDQPNDILDYEEWNVNGFTLDGSVERAYHATSFPQILRENGYKTLFVGKGHFGAIDTPSADPLEVGFDRNVGGHAAGSQGSYLAEAQYGYKTDHPRAHLFGVPHLEKYYDTDTFLTEALTLESMNMMDEAQAEGKPFFLYMAHYAVHVPFDADKRFYQKYVDMGFEEQEARYASIVEGMDKSLGDIMDYLDEREIADNTIIMFMSDNGGYSVGVRAATFDGVGKNTPLRAGKGSLYEGGVREPMLAYVPGMTAAGTICDSPIIIEDFFPTILELANAEGDTHQELDSQSFVAALKGDNINNDRPIFWHYPNNWGERTPECGEASSAIRLGDMKFIHKYETQTNELYNLTNDIGEQNNLIGSSAECDAIAKKLATILSDKLRNESSNMPIVKATGVRSAYPDETL
ncbi:MAG: sulfatase [Rikenellaceae bacterium]